TGRSRARSVLGGILAGDDEAVIPGRQAGVPLPRGKGLPRCNRPRARVYPRGFHGIPGLDARPVPLRDIGRQLQTWRDDGESEEWIGWLGRYREELQFLLGIGNVHSPEGHANAGKRIDLRGVLPAGGTVTPGRRAAARTAPRPPRQRGAVVHLWRGQVPGVAPS